MKVLQFKLKKRSFVQLIPGMLEWVAQGLLVVSGIILISWVPAIVVALATASPTPLYAFAIRDAVALLIAIAILLYRKSSAPPLSCVPTPEHSRRPEVKKAA
jgi:hypothetical protein